MPDAEPTPYVFPEFEPIGDNLIVKPPKHETASAGGILMPDGVRLNTTRYGEVIATGPGVLRGDRKPGESERYPMQTKVGDKVLMPNNLYEFPLDATNPDSVVCIGSERLFLAIIRPKE